jgi:quercetin dioxygenase-like cupin family protein
MVNPDDRILDPFKDIYRRPGDMETKEITSVVGLEMGAAEVKIDIMMVTDAFNMLKVHYKKGSTIPRHTHDDHSTACYLLSGRLRQFIGDTEFIAEPGMSWQHPRGVPHHHETLEDSVTIEVKSPAYRTW